MIQEGMGSSSKPVLFKTAEARTDSVWGAQVKMLSFKNADSKV